MAIHFFGLLLVHCARKARLADTYLTNGSLLLTTIKVHKSFSNWHTVT